MTDPVSYFSQTVFPAISKADHCKYHSSNELDGRGKVRGEYTCFISRARMKKYIQDRKRKQDLWSVQGKMVDKRPKQAVVSRKSGEKAQNEKSLTGSISTVHFEYLTRMTF